jgi:hypothetical protein
MSMDAKIYLSQQEQQLMCNSEWILTKRKIMDKTAVLLGMLADSLKPALAKETWLPVEVNTAARITKGENYKGLPYLVLDYPAVFKNENILAVRTMFWWGNHFSVTLHLAGRYKNLFEKQVCERISVFTATKSLYICINKNQWEHDFEPSNYIPLNQLERAALKIQVMEGQFIKLALKYPLSAWDDTVRLAKEDTLALLNLLRP